MQLRCFFFFKIKTGYICLKMCKSTQWFRNKSACLHTTFLYWEVATFLFFILFFFNRFCLDVLNRPFYYLRNPPMVSKRSVLFSASQWQRPATHLSVTHLASDGQSSALVTCFHPICWDRVFHWSLEMADWLSQPARKSPRSDCSCPLIAGIWSWIHLLYNKPFTQRAIASIPMYL